MRAAGFEPSPARSMRARPPPETATILVVLGPIARADIPALCESACALLEDGDADPVICDVGALVDPDAVTVDALARLQLTARRLGRGVRLHRACGDLQALLDLMGLSDVLPLGAALGVEPSGQAEEREQVRGIQEEADPGDPTR